MKNPHFPSTAGLRGRASLVAPGKSGLLAAAAALFACAATAPATTVKVNGVTVFHEDYENTTPVSSAAFPDTSDGGNGAGVYTPNNTSIGSWDSFSIYPEGIQVTNVGAPGAYGGSNYLRGVRNTTYNAQPAAKALIATAENDAVHFETAIYVPNPGITGNQYMRLALLEGTNEEDIAFVELKLNDGVIYNRHGNTGTRTSTGITIDFDSWKILEIDYVNGASTWSLTYGGQTASNLAVSNVGDRHVGAFVIGGGNPNTNGTVVYYDAVVAPVWQGAAGPSANWDVTTNWSGGVIPTGAGKTATFGPGDSVPFHSQYNVALGADRTIGTIVFDSATPYTLHLANAFGADVSVVENRRTLTSNGITVLAGDHEITGWTADAGAGATMRLSNPNPYTFDIAGGASLTLSARLGGGTNNASSNLVKTGAGALILNANSGSGSGWAFTTASTGFTVQQGTLVMTAHNAAGNSSNDYFVDSGATLELRPLVETYIENGDFEGSAPFGSHLTLNGGRLYASRSVRFGGDAFREFSLAGAGATVEVAAGKTLWVSQRSITGDSSAVFTKAGAGTMQLYANSPEFSGSTVIAEGTLALGSSAAAGGLAGPVQVNAAGTLAGRATIQGNVTVAGAISPGLPEGVLFMNDGTVVTLNGNSSYHCGFADWDGAGNGNGWGMLDADGLVIAATPENPVTLVITGVPANFAEEDMSFEIARAVSIGNFDAAAFDFDDSGFIGNGTWTIDKEFDLEGESLVLHYTAGTADPYTAWAILKGLSGENFAPGEDADGDGLTNFAEFAFDGDPLSGANDGKVVGQVAQVGGQSVLTLTLPVHAGADFDGSTAQESDPVQGTVYRIEASENLVDWDVVVSEVTGPDAQAIQGTLPGLTSGDWEYRTFRVSGTVGDHPKRFIRAVVE